MKGAAGGHSSGQKQTQPKQNMNYNPYHSPGGNNIYMNILADAIENQDPDWKNRVVHDFRKNIAEDNEA